MTYEVFWAVPAIDQAAGYLADDGPGLESVLDAVDELALDPRPEASTRVTGGLRRLRVGTYRVVYDIDDERLLVTVVHLGRLG